MVLLREDIDLGSRNWLQDGRLMKNHAVLSQVRKVPSTSQEFQT